MASHWSKSIVIPHTGVSILTSCNTLVGTDVFACLSGIFVSITAFYSKRGSFAPLEATHNIFISRCFARSILKLIVSFVSLDFLACRYAIPIDTLECTQTKLPGSIWPEQAESQQQRRCRQSSHSHDSGMFSVHDTTSGVDKMLSHLSNSTFSISRKL